MNDARRILVPTDLSACAENALAFALRWARKQGGTVHLLHVLDLYRTEVPVSATDTAELASLWERLEAASTAELERLVERYRSDQTITVEQRRDAAVVPAIAAVAREVGADLIVMGTHGRRGVSRFLLGSVAAEIVREAPCDVVVVPPNGPAGSAIRRVLAPVDFSPFSGRMLERAKEIAAAFEARVDLLHVFEEPLLPILWPGPGVVHDLMPKLKHRAEEELSRLRAEAGGPAVPVTEWVEHGHAASRIVDFARDHADALIVMGSHGYAGLDRFLLGSVTERVLRHAACPVYVHRATPEELAPPKEEAASAAG